MDTRIQRHQYTRKKGYHNTITLEYPTTRIPQKLDTRIQDRRILVYYDTRVLGYRTLGYKIEDYTTFRILGYKDTTPTGYQDTKILD